MTLPPSSPAEPDTDGRVWAALEAYLAEVEAGAAPARSVFLARHPEVAGQLAAALDTLAAVRAGPPGGEPDDLLLRTVGQFQLLGIAGRGGMGVVYKALQLDPPRPVALKVLAPGLGASVTARARFRREAETAARLHHTHIVPVFATVSGSGGPDAYAMPYIHGLSLAAVVRGVRDGFPPGLPPEFARLAGLHRADGPGYAREAAEWVRQAAEAVAAAHAVGVVHRDVKPANLLLEYTRAGQPHVWLHDFGLAYAAGTDDGWADGTVFGTTGYLSPEQAAGDPGHRCPPTDVYALGVTLFEVLTLRRPDEPGPVGGRGMPAELARVIAKAVAPAPADRYSTAGELAEDLARFLAGFPVRAGRPGWGRHATKWVGRHRRPVVAAAIAFLLAAAAGFYAERMARREAERRERLAADAANIYSPAVDDLLYATPGMLDRQTRLLEQARRVNEELLAVRPDDIRVRDQLAQVCWRLSRVYVRAGRRADGVAAAERSVALYQEVVVADPGGHLHRLDLARSYAMLAAAHNGLDPAAEAAANADALDVVRRAVADFPENLDCRDALATYLCEVGYAEARRGRHSVAEARYREAVAEAETCRRAADPAEWRFSNAVAHTHTRLGQAVWHQGRAAEALQENATALRAVDALLALDEAQPHSPRPLDRLSFRMNRAELLLDRCWWRLALGEDAAADLTVLAGVVAELIEQHRDRLGHLQIPLDHLRAWTADRAGRPAEANAALRRYTDALTARLARNPHDRDTLLDLAAAFSRGPCPWQWDAARAVEFARAAVAVAPDAAEVRVALGAALARAGDTDGATAEFARVPDDHRVRPTADLHLALLAARSGRPDEVRRWLSAAAGRAAPPDLDAPDRRREVEIVLARLGR